MSNGVAIHRFGLFDLDSGHRCLSCGGEPVALSPRLVAILLLLVSHAGQIVTRDEMTQAGWGVIVSEASIAHGMPATFIADLLEFADRLNQANQDRAAERAERALARVAIRATFASGMVAARTLDIIIANRLVDDAPTLTAWRRARRLAARPGFRHLPAPSVPANPAPERKAL